MPRREIQADFASGAVEDASIAARPDAIVPSHALCLGPTAVEDVAAGLTARAWYARYDNAALAVYVAVAGTRAWGAEVELFTFTGADVDAISLAFDASGRPVVALERSGDVWIRYWSGAAYTLTNLGAGTSPHLIHQAPESALWGELYLIYESGSSIVYREASEAYAVEHDSLSSLGTGRRIERAILDTLGRVHLLLSVRDGGAGTYSPPERLTSEFAPPCLDTSGFDDRIDVGNETIFVWRSDFEILVGCELDMDVLLVGGGSGDTIMWATAGGVAQDPATDTPLDAHRAVPGGAGGSIDLDGESGASGGGGGGQSPSNNAMWTAGGQGIPGQGNRGGGGRSTWGLLDRKVAGSGGGGGYGGAGTPGTLTGPGRGGSGGVIPGWNIAGPEGGDGSFVVVYNPTPKTGPVPGGGGSSGVQVLDAFTVQPLQTIAFTVGGGVGVGWPGSGGLAGAVGAGGAVAIRVRLSAAASAAALSGGVEVTPGDGYRYHVFTASGTLTVVTPGLAEVLAVGAGGGGGSGAGAGGGGGEVRIGALNLTTATAAITVGAGGAGGAAGGVGGIGGDSSLDASIVAFGGGGGAGAPTGAAASRATGGGGHGDAGAPGGGLAMRGYPGGPGGGFDLSAGGSALSAGGGGGAGGVGRIGATVETQGGELEQDWDHEAASYDVDPAAQYMDQTEANDRGILLTAYSAQVGFAQARVMCGHSSALVGIAARASHPSGVGVSPDGDFCGLSVGTNKMWVNGGSVTVLGVSLATFYSMQFYAADSVQEGSLQADSNFYRKADSNAAYDGVDRQWGMRGLGGTAGVGRRRWDDFMLFTDKYLEVGGVPTGGKAQILDAAGGLVAEASEASGTVVIDCSRYGNGSSGVGEAVPDEGWQTVRVLDSGESIVAEWTAGGIYPGAQFDVDGADLAFRLYPSGEAIVGIVFQETFNRLTPGPENGDGGPGLLVDAAWLAAAAGDAGYFGGGGGGGAELFVAGQGGVGGGGAGAVGAAAPTAGAANTGGGGGGSGDSAIAGAAGGSGVVVVRTVL